jgi:hypothetical protein
MNNKIDQLKEKIDKSYPQVKFYEKIHKKYVKGELAIELSNDDRKIILDSYNTFILNQ